MTPAEAENRLFRERHGFASAEEVAFWYGFKLQPLAASILAALYVSTVPLHRDRLVAIANGRCGSRSEMRDVTAKKRSAQVAICWVRQVLGPDSISRAYQTGSYMLSKAARQECREMIESVFS